MTGALVQKILASVVILTSIYLTFIFSVHYDLTRKISTSVFQIFPALMFFGFGYILSYLFTNPSFVFKQLLPIKSGFAKSALSSSIFPLLAGSFSAMTAIGGFGTLIDKLWFYWLSRRFFYFIRLIPTICMGIVAGNTLFKIIFQADQSAAIQESITKFSQIATWTTTVCSIIALLLIILIIPRLFAKKLENNGDTQ